MENLIREATNKILRHRSSIRNSSFGYLSNENLADLDHEREEEKKRREYHLNLLRGVKYDGDVSGNLMEKILSESEDVDRESFTYIMSLWIELEEMDSEEENDDSEDDDDENDDDDRDSDAGAEETREEENNPKDSCGKSGEKDQRDNPKDSNPKDSCIVKKDEQQSEWRVRRRWLLLRRRPLRLRRQLFRLLLLFLFQRQRWCDAVRRGTLSIHRSPRGSRW